LCASAQYLVTSFCGNTSDRDCRYTIKELQRDIEEQLAEVKDEALRAKLRDETKLGIFVVHNK
jgi:hypothetical protein